MPPRSNSASVANSLLRESMSESEAMAKALLGIIDAPNAPKPKTRSKLNTDEMEAGILTESAKGLDNPEIDGDEITGLLVSSLLGIGGEKK